MTDKEREVLSYIISFKLVNGFSPTIREIAAGTFTNNSTYICEILERLMDKGYIEYLKSKSRTICVIRFDEIPEN